MNIEDVIIEALETDNLALQNMSGGKYVQVKSRSLSQEDDMVSRKVLSKIGHFVGANLSWVVEMHTWSSDWKRVIIIVIINLSWTRITSLYSAYVCLIYIK
jgi:hypothetical protein